MSRLFRCLFAFMVLLAPALAQAAPRAPVVLAAASLQEAMNDAADAFARTGHPRPVVSFAGSSALARQVEAGAPADLFVSADEDWMNALAAKGLIRADTRADLLYNTLVLIEPAGQHTRLSIEKGFPLSRALGGGRLALADPAGVPAGKYAEAALTWAGVWGAVKDRIAIGENVRAALALVERGQARMGIVYATDALASNKVRVIARFPRASHPLIAYPVAQIARSDNPEARAFLAFLTSPRGKAVFRRHGFGTR
ncbi:MAG: molybdate ABC transporter substrate-binding protein [Sphingomonadales bacterium]|nr:molybdate ABC transporter substrate-binding protein [Sphingomonadales bacterium]MDE2567670.1 molybdate ABC transporter substrate-binding protein [Sphingomonadales bacterium]